VRELKLLIKISIYFFLFACSFFIFSSKTYASASRPIISAAGVDSEKNIYLELYNPTNSDIDLNDVSLIINYIDPNITSEVCEIFLNQNAIFKPFGYFLLSNNLYDLKSDGLFQCPNIIKLEEAIDIITLSYQLINYDFDQDLIANNIYYLPDTELYSDSPSYTEDFFNMHPINNSLATSFYPENPEILENSLSFIPASGYDNELFKFNFIYKSYKKHVPLEFAIDFQDENRNTIDSDCTIQELNKNSYLTGRNYQYSCTDFSAGKISYQIYAIDEEGYSSNITTWQIGPIIKKFYPLDFVFSENYEHISGNQKIGVIIDDQIASNYMVKAILSKDQILWQQIYDGSSNNFEFNSYNYENGIYYLKVAVFDSHDITRFKEKIIQINISNSLVRNLKISEIMSYPNTNEPEWFEIFNIGNQEIKNYIKIFDNIAQDLLFIDILPNEYVIITSNKIMFQNYYPNYKGKIFELSDGTIGNGLANSGDKLQLTDNFLYNLDQILIPTATKGYSFQLNNNSWQKLLPNPGYINDSEINQSIIIYQNKTASDLSTLSTAVDESEIYIVGIVNSLPGQIGSQIFYLQDDYGGIEIYSYYKDFPDLKIGQKITVLGIYNKEMRRVKISSRNDIVILEENDLKISDFNTASPQQDIFCIVKISGIITRKSSKIIEIDNKIIISASKVKDFSFKDFKIDDYIEVQGLLEEYDDYFRIILRDQNDVLKTIIAKIIEDEAPKNTIKTKALKLIPVASAQTINSKQSSNLETTDKVNKIDTIFNQATQKVLYPITVISAIISIYFLIYKFYGKNI